MGVREESYEDLSEREQMWLRDQHPRGAQIIADMIARDTGEETTAQEVVDAQRTPQSPSEGGDVPPYEKWSAKELKAEANARGLETDGKKDDLVARLYAHDEETENQ